MLVGAVEMDYLKNIQAIIELVQKRPIVSLLCLLCLMVIIFSPLIMALVPAHNALQSLSQIQNDFGKGKTPQPLNPSGPSYPTLPTASVIQPATNSPASGTNSANHPIVPIRPTASVITSLPTEAPAAVAPPPAGTSPVSIATPAPLTMPVSLNIPASSDRYYVVVASRSNREAAIEAASGYASRFPAEVYQTPNGWYAITIGRYPKTEAQRILSQESLTQSIPQGAWLSPGKNWLGKVYP